MSTGFTQIVEEDDASFAEFIWHCAKAFSLDDEALQRSEESTLALLKEATERLERLEAMDAATIQKESSDSHRHAMAAIQEINANYDRRRSRILVMHLLVEKWGTPSTEHVRFKNFLLEELDTALAMLTFCPLPVELTPTDWHQREVSLAQRDKEYYEGRLAELRQRAEKSKKWLADLEQSVPRPEEKV